MWDSGTKQWLNIPCPSDLHLLFDPIGCDGRPDPNPGPLQRTEACYEFIDTQEVVIEVPLKFDCAGTTLYFHHWRLGDLQCLGSDTGGDCVQDPAGTWVPYRPLADPVKYGCSYDHIITLRLCDPASNPCDIEICGFWKSTDTGPDCRCYCDCFGCYAEAIRGVSAGALDCDLGTSGDECVPTPCDTDPCPP